MQTSWRPFSAITPTLWNIIFPEVRLVPTLLAFQKGLHILLGHPAWRFGNVGVAEPAKDCSFREIDGAFLEFIFMAFKIALLFCSVFYVLGFLKKIFLSFSCFFVTTQSHRSQIGG